MTDKNLSFLTEDTAKTVWSDYLRRLRKAGRHIHRQDWIGFENDIGEHVRMSLKDHHGTETDRLKAALVQVGDPDELVHSYMRDMPRPKPSATRRVVSAVVRSFSFVGKSAACIIAVIAVTMSVAHILSPDVGLWIHGDGTWSLSFDRHADSRQILRDSFGYWGFLLAGIILAFLIVTSRRSARPD